MKRKSHAAQAVVCCAAAALLPVAARAQSTDAWQFGASLYLYLPSVSGTTTFSGGGSNVGLDAHKLLENLRGVFMGSLEARKGPWGGFTDFIYLDLGNSKSGFRDMTVGGAALPVNAAADADFDLKGSAWTLAGTYRMVPDPRSPVDVLAGARMLDMKQTFTWQINGNVASIPLPGRGGKQEAKLTNWDGIVGVKGRLAVGADRKWFLPYYLDIGAGESELTWQAMGGVGYSFGWGDVVGAWRYLDYKMKSGTSIEKLTFSGPTVAAVFRW
jgi:hypothetical protein